MPCVQQRTFLRAVLSARRHRCCHGQRSRVAISGARPCTRDNGWAARRRRHRRICCGSEQIYVVTNRSELIAALNNGVASSRRRRHPSNEPKIIYVKGTIDANVDDDNQPLDLRGLLPQRLHARGVPRDVRSGRVGA